MLRYLYRFGVFISNVNSYFGHLFKLDLFRRFRYFSSILSGSKWKPAYILYMSEVHIRFFRLASTYKEAASFIWCRVQRGIWESLFLTCMVSNTNFISHNTMIYITNSNNKHSSYLCWLNNHIQMQNQLAFSTKNPSFE